MSKIEILDYHNGEIGEAIHRMDHLFEAEEYHYDKGQVLEVYEHDVASQDVHIFTDLDSGHRFKIEPTKYRRLL